MVWVLLMEEILHPVNDGEKLPTSTGDRRISEASTVGTSALQGSQTFQGRTNC